MEVFIMGTGVKKKKRNNGTCCCQQVMVLLALLAAGAVDPAVPPSWRPLPPRPSPRQQPRPPPRRPAAPPPSAIFSSRSGQVPVISAAHFDRFVNFPGRRIPRERHRAPPPRPPRPLPRRPPPPQQVGSSSSSSNVRSLRYISPGAGADNGVELLGSFRPSPPSSSSSSPSVVRVVTSYPPNPTALPLVQQQQRRHPGPSPFSPPNLTRDPFKRPFRHVKHVLPFSASHSNDGILLTSGSAPVVFQVLLQ